MQIVEGCHCEICFKARIDTLQRPPSYMMLCPHCGCKRCPTATYHLFRCSGSNDVGQPGSYYGPAPVHASVDDMIAEMDPTEFPQTPGEFEGRIAQCLRMSFSLIINSTDRLYWTNRAGVWSKHYAKFKENQNGKQSV